jgi:SAM-dependent methyltransferase
MDGMEPYMPTVKADTGSAAVKERVRQFYDRVGWQPGGEGVYQNARYEDLRPVAREYVHRCHLRVARHLKPAGRYFLDAGSGPVQYPEYLVYSQGYRYRVCVDLSGVALQEARIRLGEHALCVVADVAHLPFKTGTFEGAVSLHTFHHLPAAEQAGAYDELFRAMAPGSSAVVVNGWTDAPLMRRLKWMVTLTEGMARLARRRKGAAVESSAPAGRSDAEALPTGTFVEKIDAAWLKRQLQGKMRFEIRCWRSLSVRFMRAVIKPWLGGRFWLRLIFWLEERFPRYFGENGQYPLVVIFKPGVG